MVTSILFIVGLVLLIVGADTLVKGASKLAFAIGISPLIVGLTIVAFGTSSPELAVILQASFAGQSDIAIGNVVGSNISNVLIVLGISALVKPVPVLPQLIRIEAPLMIGVSFALWFFASDGIIGRLDGAIFVAGIIIYTIRLIVQSRKQHPEQAQEVTHHEMRPSNNAKTWIVNIGYIVAGLVMLVLGSDWLVKGAVAFATWLGISELIIGLTIVAIGTSLPEIATSVIASLRNEGDILVGNVVGSNMFNILSVLGCSSLITPIAVSAPALSFDIPVMIVVAIACLPVFHTSNRISRWEGGFFIAGYAAYVTYLIMYA